MERISRTSVGMTGIIAGASAIIAVVCGATLSTIEADKQKTLQMVECLEGGHTYISTVRTLCVSPEHTVLDKHNEVEVKTGETK